MQSVKKFIVKQGIKSIIKGTVIKANAISHCQFCGCTIDSDDKVTTLEVSPDAECGKCGHRVESHLDW